jgi:ATP-dependent Lon protease
VLPQNDGDAEFEIPDTLPLLPIRDLVVYPYMIVPLYVSRDVSLAAVDEALEGDRLVLLCAQREVADEAPGPQAIHPIGTVGMVMRTRKLPDGRVKVLVQGLMKAKVTEWKKTTPGFHVRIATLRDDPVQPGSLEAEALMRSVKESLEKLAQVGKGLSQDLLVVLSGISEPGRLADLVASNLGLKVADAQALLEDLEPLRRLRKVNEQLGREVAVQAMRQKIQHQAKEEMSRTQREYFLREQLRQIQNELGEGDGKSDELDELRRRLEKAKLPPDAKAEAKKQLGRLEGMNQDSAEATVVRTYLDWLADLPWSKTTEDNLDVKRAREILDEDHEGLERVKERLLEYLGVRKLKKDMRGPILCLSGPPGVGKTSLGRSIARATGRAFVRVSLGGVRDEAEIRGHRRTYVGAMPGRIIQGLKQAGSRNPVFLLDEVDKLGADVRGDPSSALLEVLDPEQNHRFRDHYLNLDFDLSQVLWVATANLVDNIPAALRDRMEVIALAGYSAEEKLRIARRHLVGKQLGENGLNETYLEISDRALKEVIARYTREAGLRGLERQIAQICRKVARRVAEGRETKTTVRAKNLPRYLGIPRHGGEVEGREDAVGVATGLAWTSAGGELLKVEVSAIAAGRSGLILTGQLGEVMKESAQAALTFAKTKAVELGSPPGFFEKHEIHIHVPAGAIPKDGPSAGVTMATALVSLATGIPVRGDVCMTGEVTLRGRVLPVGGIKEKILAAARAGLTDVVVPAGNEKDLAEIPRHVRKKIAIHPVRTLADAMAVALTRRPAPAAEASTSGTA